MFIWKMLATRNDQPLIARIAIRRLFQETVIIQKSQILMPKGNVQNVELSLYNYLAAKSSYNTPSRKAKSVCMICLIPIEEISVSIKITAGTIRSTRI